MLADNQKLQNAIKQEDWDTIYLLFDKYLSNFYVKDLVGREYDRGPFIEMYFNRFLDGRRQLKPNSEIGFIRKFFPGFVADELKKMRKQVAPEVLDQIEDTSNWGKGIRSELNVEEIQVSARRLLFEHRTLHTYLRLVFGAQKPISKGEFAKQFLNISSLTPYLKNWGLTIPGKLKGNALEVFKEKTIGKWIAEGNFLKNGRNIPLDAEHIEYVQAAIEILNETALNTDIGPGNDCGEMS
jgi:hypothetical protein